MRGTIKVGTTILQDFRVMCWPNALPPKRHNGKVSEDMIFEMEWNGKYWNCKADGYGFMSHKEDIGDYGNGSIFVYDKEGVELLD